MAFLTRPAVAAAAALSMAATLTAAGPLQLTEAQAKAALLFNMAAFVEWPQAAQQPAPTLLIGVAGDAGVLQALKSVEGQTVNGRGIAVRAIPEQGRAADCQILFVHGDRDADSLATLRDLSGQAVLTVGESPGFVVRNGGIIRVYFEGPRLRFDVSVTNADRAHLRISSKVLGLAQLVGHP